jgi:hypothetical protein
MANWTTIKVKTVSRFELFSYPKILFAYEAFFCKGCSWINRTVFGQCGSIPRQCPRAITIPDMQCKPVNSPESITAIFVDDTAIVATDSDPNVASHKLQPNLLAIKKLVKNGE